MFKQWKEIMIWGFVTFLTLSLTFVVYGTANTNHRSLINDKRISDLEKRMDIRDAVAKQYVPRIEATESLVKMHSNELEELSERLKAKSNRR